MTTTTQPTVCEVRSGLINEISNAAKKFAEHEVRQTLDQGMFRAWRCQKPGTWVMGFDVFTTPGRLVVSGGIGFLAVERTNDMIAWSRSAVNSISYFAEKVPREIKVKEHSADVVRAWIHETLAEENLKEAYRTALTNLLEWTDLGWAHRVAEELHDSGVVDGCDYPDFNVYTRSFLWCREAVKLLLSKLPPSP